MLRWLTALALLLAVLGGATYFVAGRGDGPLLAIEQPGNSIGRSSTFQISAVAPARRLSHLRVRLEQGGRAVELFALGATQGASATPFGEDGLRVVRPFGKETIGALKQGPARLVVEAGRMSFLGLRELSSTAAKDLMVKLEPPRVAIVSTHHYIRHGGSEGVVYRVTPHDVASGVRVGDLEYAGYPAAGAGVAGDPSLRMAFFGLLAEQEFATPIRVFARDDAGNETTAAFVDDVFPGRFRHSRIVVDDAFLGRVVPSIVSNSPELKADNAGDLLPTFLKVNGELRRLNAEHIIKVAATSAPKRLWTGPFVQLGNSQVEAGFGDRRTYLYGGKEVDRQVHLGFDLAVTSAVPVAAANTGRVVSASWLGIYGNCVIVDHGMGVASLYAHLSSMDVKVGDAVGKGDLLGRSGMTGLAGGDHLHFAVLLGGRPVNPVDWWDPKWMTDRVERKILAAGAGPP